MAALGAVVNIVGPVVRDDDTIDFAGNVPKLEGDSNENEGTDNATRADQVLNIESDDDITSSNDSHHSASQGDCSKNYEVFRELLSDAIALGAIRSCIFDHLST